MAKSFLVILLLGFTGVHIVLHSCVLESADSELKPTVG